MKLWMLLPLLAGCFDPDGAIPDDPATETLPPDSPATIEYVDGEGIATGDFGTAILRNGVIEGTTIVAFDLASGDVDGDGLTELLAATDQGVYVSGRTGTSLLPPSGVTSLEVGDLNGDGTDDYVAMTREGIFAMVGSESALIVRYAVFGVADVDGDGDDEVITAGADWCSVFQWETRAASTWYFPAETWQASAVTFLGGEIVLGYADRLRFLRPDGSYRDLASVPVSQLEAWEAGLVVLDGDGAAWMVRSDQFGNIESEGIAAIERIGSTLYLLRGIARPMISER